MSIQTQIERIAKNISAAYEVINEKGGNLPQDKNSSNLAEAISTISTGENIINGNAEILDSGLDPNFMDLYSSMSYVGINTAYDVQLYKTEVLTGEIETADVEMEVVGSYAEN